MIIPLSGNSHVSDPINSGSSSCHSPAAPRTANKRRTERTTRTRRSGWFAESRMREAQIELGSNGPPSSLTYNYFSPPYPPTTGQNRSDFQTLVTAIGRAIGNVGAHETGHQRWSAGAAPGVHALRVAQV